MCCFSFQPDSFSTWHQIKQEHNSHTNSFDCTIKKNKREEAGMEVVNAEGDAGKLTIRM